VKMPVVDAEHHHSALVAQRAANAIRRERPPEERPCLVDDLRISSVQEDAQALSPGEGADVPVP
jgi:hypothetical protein